MSTYVGTWRNLISAIAIAVLSLGVMVADQTARTQIHDSRQWVSNPLILIAESAIQRLAGNAGTPSATRGLQRGQLEDGCS